MSLYESFYCSSCFKSYYIHPQELVTVCRCIVLFRCVLVYWCGSAGVGWCPSAGQSTMCKNLHLDTTSDTSLTSFDVFVFRGRASVVSIVPVLRYRRSGVRPQVGVRDSRLPQQVQTCSVTHSVHYSMDTGVRRPEIEVNHASPSSVKDKNGCSPTSYLLTYLLASSY